MMVMESSLWRQFGQGQITYYLQTIFVYLCKDPEGKSNFWFKSKTSSLVLWMCLCSMRALYLVAQWGNPYWNITSLFAKDVRWLKKKKSASKLAHMPSVHIRNFHKVWFAQSTNFHCKVKFKAFSFLWTRPTSCLIVSSQIDFFVYYQKWIHT